MGRAGWRQQVEVRMGDEEVKAVFGLFSSSWKGEWKQEKSNCILQRNGNDEVKGEIVDVVD